MNIAADAPQASAEGQASDPYAMAVSEALSAPTAYAHAKALDRLEALALAKSQGEASQPGQSSAEDLALPSPESAGAYQFIPLPGVEPMGEAESSEVRTALFDAGIPAEFVTQGYANLQQLELSGAMASPEAYESAVHKCRDVLHRTHGEGASAIIRDGIAYIEDLARKYPALEHAANAAFADPFMVTNAASLKRHGTSRRR